MSAKPASHRSSCRSAVGTGWSFTSRHEARPGSRAPVRVPDREDKPCGAGWRIRMPRAATSRRTGPNRDALSIVPVPTSSYRSVTFEHSGQRGASPCPGCRCGERVSSQGEDAPVRAGRRIEVPMPSIRKVGLPRQVEADTESVLHTAGDCTITDWTGQTRSRSAHTSAGARDDPTTGCGC